MQVRKGKARGKEQAAVFEPSAARRQVLGFTNAKLRNAKPSSVDAAGVLFGRRYGLQGGQDAFVHIDYLNADEWLPVFGVPGAELFGCDVVPVEHVAGEKLATEF